MYAYTCTNLTSGRLLLPKAFRADRLGERIKGLLACPGLEQGQGLWLVPCKQIHTFFMRFCIDVIFLNAEHRVLWIRENMPAWRITPYFWQAASVLEMAGGSLGVDAVRQGDQLRFARSKGEEHAA
jgi:uncharacterized protein